MDLNQDIWYVRLFFWSLGIWEAFRIKSDDSWKYDEDYVREQGTNLCFFIRVITVYTPLVFLLHLAVAVIAVTSITYLPISLFGGGAYAGVLVGGTIGTLAYLGIVRLMKSKKEARMTDEKHTERLKQLAKNAERIPYTPHFRDIVWEYILAQKKKICPFITFNKEVGS